LILVILGSIFWAMSRNADNKYTQNSEKWEELLSNEDLSNGNATTLRSKSLQRTAEIAPIKPEQLSGV
jgi:hypothetical protein